jgi:hypothetical protein
MEAKAIITKWMRIDLIFFENVKVMASLPAGADVETGVKP